MTDRLAESENWVRMSGVSRRAALGGGMEDRAGVTAQGGRDSICGGEDDGDA